MSEPLSIWLYLEDYDNAELDPGDWIEVMREKVEDYNAEHGTTLNPKNTVMQYISRKGEHDQ